METVQLKEPFHFINPANKDIPPIISYTSVPLSIKEIKDRFHGNLF